MARLNAISRSSSPGLKPGIVVNVPGVAGSSPAITRGGSRSTGSDAASVLRHLVTGEVLEDTDQAGMVPALAAKGGGGVEQLLRRRGVRQGKVQRAGARQREAQVLLVQFDAEAGVEGA